MNRFFLYIIALALALTLGACDGLTAPELADAGTAQAGLTLGTPASAIRPQALELGQTARIAGAGLTFDALVEDSRCPVGMACVWGGEAVTRFTLRTADGTAYPVELALPGGRVRALPLDEAPMAVAGGYVIRLTRVQPYPGYTREERLPVTATVVVAPCPGRCVEVWPPQGPDEEPVGSPTTPRP
jgi:hypothetical protein